MNRMHLVTARRRAAAGACAAAILTAAGCSHSSGRQAPGWAKEIKAAAEHATSPFARRVLADGVITQAEYHEAVRRYLACARLHGVGLVARHEQPVGVRYTYRVDGTVTANVRATMNRCIEGPTGQIEALYGSEMTSPEHRDFRELIADCLVKSDVAPPGYSAAQFDRDLHDRFRNAPFDTDDGETAEAFSVCMELG